jgi:putative ABC transport system permease protein
MIRDYIRFSLRNFRNRKLFAFLNIAGLTIGIVASSLIFLYISYELSFDRYNKNAGSIFRVYSTFTMTGTNQSWVQTPAPLAAFLTNKFPDLTKAVRIAVCPKCLVSSGEKNFFEDKFIIADSTIFNVFTLPLLIGDPGKVLSQPNSVVLSRSLAEKYFGKNDPVGKTLRYNRTILLTVSGIMQDIPSNSHLRFDMVTGMSNAKTLLWSDFLENRMNTVVFTYLLTRPGIDIKELEKSIGESTGEYQGGDFGDNLLYHIQPLTSIHLHSSKGGEFSPNGDIKSVYILGTIALLILVIACINYINLSLALNSRRSVELGMRRIMGARRSQLIFLYLSDAAILVGVSVLISTFIIQDQLALFGSVAGIQLINNLSGSRIITSVALLFFLISLIIGLISGSISSSTNPMSTLKKTAIDGKKSHLGHGVLIIFQFGVSIALISVTLFVYRQMSYMKNLNLGFSKEQLMVIPLNDDNIKTKIKSLKQDLLSNPAVLSATATSDLPGKLIWVASIKYDGLNEQVSPTMTYLETDRDFLTTYGVTLKEGYMPGDTTSHYSGTQYLINESAAKNLGWEKPVGKKFSCYNGHDGFVTGVIKDFHFKSLHEEIQPLFLFMRDNDAKYLTVKLNTTGISGSIESIKKLWNKLAPDAPFEYFFYDSFYDQLYKKEASFGKIIFIFSALAILIACLGLFGLAVFFSEKRTKEIGIRKVNGAVIPEIMIMLNKVFIKWIIIAFIIAVPLVWFSMHKWLQSFAYKTNLSWWIFLLAGLVAICVAFMTVSWQSLKAATRNPVEALRDE